MTRTRKRITTRRRRSEPPARLLVLHEKDHIRPTRVLAAQARIASGHYDRPEVKAYLLEALLQELRGH